eukprot:TRINITY_DN12048_c0_g1_i1.p1 TRINITY_DN12048_c0_g1~~TRINITY_DN12048_c0_g1_i1.p1  ORF type:complete len:100 (+),score=3.46 TRINITY_DN12048_c0_g1_i1:167-466(+)
MASPSFGKAMIHLGYRKMAKSHCPRLSTTCPCDTVSQSPSSLQPTPVTRPCTLITIIIYKSLVLSILVNFVSSIFPLTPIYSHVFGNSIIYHVLPYYFI